MCMYHSVSVLEIECREEVEDDSLPFGEDRPNRAFGQLVSRLLDLLLLLQYYKRFLKRNKA